MQCERSQKIHALYDGALGGSERAEMQAHASVCAECGRELVELQRIGRFVKLGAPPIVASSALAGMRMRLKSRRVARLYEPRVIGMAKWLTSAAAAVMLSCGVALMNMPARVVSSPNPSALTLNTSGWEALAVAANEDSGTTVDPLSPVEDFEWNR